MNGARCKGSLALGMRSNARGPKEERQTEGVEAEAHAIHLRLRPKDTCNECKPIYFLLECLYLGKLHM
jgi:hypothetical protein